MASRRTNVALLAALLAAFATGAGSFAVGARWNLWVVAAHAIAAFVIVLLAPWKSVIARRGLAKKRPDTGISLALSVLTLVALISGIAHSWGLWPVTTPVTAMQVHVAVAVTGLPVAFWHVMKRPARIRHTDFGRRGLLRMGIFLGAAAALYTGSQSVVRAAALPGARRRFTGSFERGSFTPEKMPVTQWLDDPVPQIDAARWVLTAGSRRWSYEELRRYRRTLRATIDCTGGWYAQQDWEGVPLSRLLPDASRARSIYVVSVTGYGRRFPASEAPRLLLATGVGGRPLEAGHGFPARLVAPGRRGFWWVKWVSRIETSARPWWLQLPFPPT
jgi:hypothetical protein